MSDNCEQDDNLMRINVSKIRAEASEISAYVESGISNKLELSKKYQTFSKAYPTLFNNLVDKKLSFEELDVILNTLDNAQEHFIKNFNK
jgi:hypothetical protein